MENGLTGIPTDIFDQKLTDRFHSESLKWVEKNVKSRYLNRTIEEGIVLVSNIYEKFNEILPYFESKSSCTKGCVACCKFFVETTALEYLILKQYFLGKFNKEERENIINKARLSMKENMDVKTVKISKVDYFNKNIPCIFLINNECSVYDARPYQCRKYLSAEDKDKCTGVFFSISVMDLLSQAIVKLNVDVYNESMISSLPLWIVI